MKILILASNPRKDLNLDVEIRELKEVIEKSQKREEFQVVDELAVQVGDLQDLLLKHQPHIVHFCGHGGGEEGLVFLNDHNESQAVTTEALSDLFRLVSGQIQCILLNACYSELQANLIVKNINYVIGMNQAIRDDAAIAFSKGFYRALGYGLPIEKAFEFGCNAIQLEISSRTKKNSEISSIKRKAEIVNMVENTIIPEHLKPVLKKNDLTNIETKSSLESHIFQNLISQADLENEINRFVKNDPKSKRFQDLVQTLIANRIFTNIFSATLKIFVLSGIVAVAIQFLKFREIIPDPNLAETLTPSKPSVVYPQSNPSLFPSQSPSSKTVPPPYATKLNPEKSPSKKPKKLTPQELIKAINQLDEDRKEHYKIIISYLDQNDFNNAEYATYIFLQALANDKMTKLMENDIRNLPCRDLYLLDSLWQIKSNHQFGFGVQKNIYLKLKLIDSPRPITERWGEAVGWYSNGSWITLDQMNYSLSAKQGHLPVGGVYVSDVSPFEDRDVAAHLGKIEKCIDIP